MPHSPALRWLALMGVALPGCRGARTLEQPSPPPKASMYDEIVHPEGEDTTAPPAPPVDPSQDADKPKEAAAPTDAEAAPTDAEPTPTAPADE